MYVKLIESAPKGPAGSIIRRPSRTTTYLCDHIQATHHADGSGLITRIDIEMVPAPPEVPDGIVSIQSAGEVVYITNNKGDTIDKYSLAIANAVGDETAKMKVAK